jgi:hypothetical protein
MIPQIIPSLKEVCGVILPMAINRGTKANHASRDIPGFGKERARSAPESAARTYDRRIAAGLSENSGFR